MWNDRCRKLGTVLMLLVMLVQVIAPFTVCADEPERKTVRVGWHEPPYFITDTSGRKSGYSYEYQRKVAAYTGWDYEYVEGTWSELLQKLKTGEIDLLSDMSYSEERAEQMLFSSIPMGTESYYVFVAPDNTEISADSIATLNGKRIGVAKGSIQKEYFLDWAETHNIHANIVEQTCSEEESLRLLGTKFDAFVTMDVYGTPDTAVPVCKVGSSYFYFAVNKNRPDLLTELDAALNKIQDEDKYFDQHLHDAYLNSGETARFLSTAEKGWLAEHGPVRVGYQDSYLAFCAKDPATGMLTGAMKDYLDYAATAFENAEITFEPVAFQTVNAAIEALQDGEIDCMFPANLTEFDAEQLGLILSPSLMHSEMQAVVRAGEQKEFLRKSDVTAAVNEGNVNYEIFLDDHYPFWDRKHYPNTSTALEAVSKQEADCVLISNYRYSNISKLCERMHLTTVDTGIDMNYCFAVRAGETQLYAILAKVVGVVPDSTVHSALTYYSTEDMKTTFLEMLRDNLLIVMTVITAVLLVILILLLRSIRAEKKVQEGEHLVKALNKRVFVDALTSVRNKGAFTEYLDKLQELIDQGGAPDFAVGMFDCNDLKSINDRHGHDKGDIYLKSACRLICRVFDHSPVFRIGGDEFAAILMNEDFRNREALMEQFEAQRRSVCDAAENVWDEVHIAIGIAVFDSQKDSTVADTVRRADQMMYVNKRLEKGEE